MGRVLCLIVMLMLLLGCDDDAAGRAPKPAQLSPDAVVEKLNQLSNAQAAEPEAARPVAPSGP